MWERETDRDTDRERETEREREQTRQFTEIEVQKWQAQENNKIGPFGPVYLYGLLWSSVWKLINHSSWPQHTYHLHRWKPDPHHQRPRCPARRPEWSVRRDRNNSSRSSPQWCCRGKNISFISSNIFYALFEIAHILGTNSKRIVSSALSSAIMAMAVGYAVS